MNETVDLTIAIPVLNEETNLPACLNAIGTGFAQRVVIIDSGSTDRTREIAKEFGIEIIEFVWNGQFPKKRNWFLRNHKPNTKWILFLDADEYLTTEFKSEVRKALNGNNGQTGYWLNYSIYFLKKPLRWGYPLRKLALFQLAAGEYERIDEDQWSTLDMEVHEHPVLEGKTGTIRSKIDHNDFRNISHYIAKHNEYSDWEASRVLKAGRNQKIYQNWGLQQKVKYGIIRTPLAGVVYFFGSYILMGGFLDGSRGLILAILKMSYFTQVYCKIREKECKSV